MPCLSLHYWCKKMIMCEVVNISIMSHRSSTYDGHFDHYHHIPQTSHSVFSGNVSWVPITRRSGTCWEWSCCSSFWFACVKLTSYEHFWWTFCFWSILFLLNLFSLFWRLSPASRQATRTQLSVEEEPGLILCWFIYIHFFILHWTCYHRRIFLIVEKMCCIHMIIWPPTKYAECL